MMCMSTHTGVHVHYVQLINVNEYKTNLKYCGAKRTYQSGKIYIAFQIHIPSTMKSEDKRPDKFPAGLDLISCKPGYKYLSPSNHTKI